MCTQWNNINNSILQDSLKSNGFGKFISGVTDDSKWRQGCNHIPAPVLRFYVCPPLRTTTSASLLHIIASLFLKFKSQKIDKIKPNSRCFNYVYPHHSIPFSQSDNAENLSRNQSQPQNINCTYMPVETTYIIELQALFYVNFGPVQYIIVLLLCYMCVWTITRSHYNPYQPPEEDSTSPPIYSQLRSPADADSVGSSSFGRNLLTCWALRCQVWKWEGSLRVSERWHCSWNIGEAETCVLPLM